VQENSVLVINLKNPIVEQGQDDFNFNLDALSLICLSDSSPET
jgi:hypothetical protein